MMCIFNLSKYNLRLYRSFYDVILKITPPKKNIKNLPNKKLVRQAHFFC